VTRAAKSRHASRLAQIRRQIGERIRRERKQLRLTQEHLAERLEISANYLAHLERGSRGASLETLLVIADRLRIPLPALLTPLSGED